MKGSNLVNGEWRHGICEFTTFNPSDLSETIRYSKASAGNTADACAAARVAHPAWRAWSTQEKPDLLRKAGDILAERQLEMATMVSREEGQALAEATGETLFAARCFHYHAAELLRPAG